MTTQYELDRFSDLMKQGFMRSAMAINNPKARKAKKRCTVCGKPSKHDQCSTECSVKDDIRSGR